MRKGKGFTAFSDRVHAILGGRGLSRLILESCRNAAAEQCLMVSGGSVLKENLLRESWRVGREVGCDRKQSGSIDERLFIGRFRPPGENLKCRGCDTSSSKRS